MHIGLIKRVNQLLEAISPLGVAKIPHDLAPTSDHCLFEEFIGIEGNETSRAPYGRSHRIHPTDPIWTRISIGHRLYCCALSHPALL